MSKDEIKASIVLVAVFVFGALCGFFIGKGIYQHTYGEKVARDTVILRDTVPDYQPVPVDSARARYITRYLPVVKHDTVSRVELITMHDSVAVEVPITSKHYQSNEYDAWVSGFEPSLDSIKVYQRTEYITERVTLSKPPNKWELDAVAGLDYNTALDKYTPYALGELLYKPNRLQFGVHGGVAKTDKVTPIIGIKAKIRLL